MSYHILYIFSKNRDAVAALKGYSYQQLKTLEDWLENRILGKQADIYCEYEDDILVRDILQHKTIFKQIKLYSTDFSFSSEGITKAISHFFSLYVKGDYSFDDVEFHFETNVSIVGKDFKDNDALLLSEWNEHQVNISSELMSRLRVRVKNILDEYISKRYKELVKNSSTEEKEGIDKAKHFYDNLSDDNFDSFIKCIKWDFSKEESSSAVESILDRIKRLISRLPLPLDTNKIEIYSSLLVNAVFQSSIQDEPEQRKLTLEMLDKILLDAGDLEDRWYSDTYSQFKNSQILTFFPGEFQSVIAAASYCRWKNLDDTHKYFWLEILKNYVEAADTPVLNKRKAIYEYIFLKIGHEGKEIDANHSLNLDSDLIKFYIESYTNDVYLSDIEKDIVFIHLIKTQIKIGTLQFPEEKIEELKERIDRYLQSEVETTINVDRLCELYELQGHLAQTDTSDQIASYEKGLEYYRKIIPMINETTYYSLASLYDQMMQITKIIAGHGLDNRYLDLTDDFMEEIKPHAEKIGLREKSAYSLIERAILHKKQNTVDNNLRALGLLHKAKDELRLDYTRKAYTFSLLQISKVYLSLGMTYASKYYALLSFWSIWQATDESLKQYLPDSFFQIMHVDYEQGSWIRALTDFELYLFSKKEFDQRGFEIENDERFQFAISEIAMVIYSAPILHPPLSAFIEKMKQNFGFIWTDYIRHMIPELSKNLPTKDAIYKLLQNKIIDLPLNDIGTTRNIHFKALSIDWYFEFDNTLDMSGIAEEFISAFQITLCEIATKNPKVFQEGKVVKIKIEKGHFQKNFIGDDNWLIKIPEFDGNQSALVNRHYQYIGILTQSILQSVSHLSKDEFLKFFMDLLANNNLARKIIEAAAYQRVFKNSVMSEPEVSSVQSKDMIPFTDETFSLNYINYLHI